MSHFLEVAQFSTSTQCSIHDDSLCVYHAQRSVHLGDSTNVLWRTRAVLEGYYGFHNNIGGLKETQEASTQAGISTRSKAKADQSGPKDSRDVLVTYTQE